MNKQELKTIRDCCVKCIEDGTPCVECKMYKPYYPLCNVVIVKLGEYIRNTEEVDNGEDKN
jgi:hypothetical protein